MSSSENISGLASSIRSSLESTTFDLAGHSGASISHAISSAFSTPFTHLTTEHEMIRITFIVGGGKLSRQKYDEKAMQFVTNTLRKECGFEEDRGASCVRECGGTFKTQHDTGKNVFTVVVFPKVEDQNATMEDGHGSLGPSEQYPISFPLMEGTPQHTILLASEDTFSKMVNSTMCPSWSEKKSCSEMLKYALDTVHILDSKLMSGTPLSEDEQEFYDAVGGTPSVEAKCEFLKKSMQNQVESGKITSSEKEKLLSQVTERIDTLNDEIDTALANSQEKKAAKLTAQKEKAQARKTMIESHTPQPPHPLKYQTEINKLRKELQPLIKLEQSAKGRLLTMKETRELGAKDDLEEEILALEEKSRGWFEEDDAFENRVELSRAKANSTSGSGKGAAAKKGGKGKVPGTGSRSVAANTAWLTPGGLAAKQNALGKKAVTNKTKKTGGTNLFAAMMDSDSDSD